MPDRVTTLSEKQNFLTRTPKYPVALFRALVGMRNL